MKRLIATLVAPALLLSPALQVGALADAAPAGHAGGDRTHAHHYDVDGPAPGGVEWRRDLGVDLAGRVFEDAMAIDQEGRAFVQGRIEDREDEDMHARHWAQAVDTTTGEMLWDQPLLDLSASCHAVATDDGRLIGMLERRTPTNSLPASVLVAVDADTGRLLEGQRFTTEEPRLTTCPTRLVLAGDLVLIPVGGGDPGIRAVDITTWNEVWSYSALTKDGRSANNEVNPQLVLSEDGETVYHLSVKDPDAPVKAFHLHAIRVADGSIRGRVELPGTSGAHGTRRFIAVPDGVLVSLDRCDGAPLGNDSICLVKVSDVPGRFGIDFQVSPRDAEGQPAPLITLTDIGDGRVAGWVAGSGDIAAVDLLDGKLVAVHTPGSFSNNSRQLISDRDGTLFHGTFGSSWLESFTFGEDGIQTHQQVPTCSVSTDGLTAHEPATVGGISHEGVLVMGTSMDVMEDGEKVGETFVLVGLTEESRLPRGTCPREVKRHAGPSREETGVAVSRASFADGGAKTVVLATSTNYPDALAGGPLAATLEAPLLLNRPERLHPAVRGEIERLGATEAIILGGRGAISDVVLEELRRMGLATERIAGTDRFDTARLIAQRLQSNWAYVVEGAHADPARGWADAVAASALASYKKAPILLVTRDEVPAATQRALREQAPALVVVVGGEGAVSEQTRLAASDWEPGGAPEASSKRISGSSRYATSVAVASEGYGFGGVHARQLWFATGRSWADALTAGPAAARAEGILLLVDGQDPQLVPEQREYLARGENERFERIVFVGGRRAITPEVEAALLAQLPS